MGLVRNPQARQPKPPLPLHLFNPWGGAACNNTTAFPGRMRLPSAELEVGERWCKHCAQKLQQARNMAGELRHVVGEG